MSKTEHRTITIPLTGNPDIDEFLQNVKTGEVMRVLCREHFGSMYFDDRISELQKMIANQNERFLQKNTQAEAYEQQVKAQKEIIIELRSQLRELGRFVKHAKAIVKGSV